MLAQGIGLEKFNLHALDYLTFVGYFLCLSLIGYLAGRKRREEAAGYFLAGRSLPWYVVGSSYIAANISSEQFIGMVGSAYVFGICVATPEWSCIIAFSFLIWIFIPFLMVTQVFTTPEFLEKRFNKGMRDTFAVMTILMNVVVILAGVIYGGGLMLDKLFGLNEWGFLQAVEAKLHLTPIWFSVMVIGVVAGGWAIWGGLKSVAWMDVLTIIIMVVGGLSVTYFGLKSLGGDRGGVIDGFKTMVERNQTPTGEWAEGVRKHVPDMLINATTETPYHRLSVVQPASHTFFPWTHWVFSFFYIGLWYMVINQFMVQRIFAAKDMYHARMGIVLASYLKLLLPFIVVVPGLILFAKYPKILQEDVWTRVQPEADKGYVTMLQAVVPIGLRGLFLAALFGAIQSTVSAVLNSTSTVFTIDVYRRFFKANASDESLVRVGRWSGAAFLLVAIAIAYLINKRGSSLLYYIQAMYSFLAPPFSAVFLLGSLWRRINGKGALTTVFVGFAFAVALKLLDKFYVTPLVAELAEKGEAAPTVLRYLTTFPIQALMTWAVCMAVCPVVSLMTAPPRPEQVTDGLTFNLKKMHIKGEMGGAWYRNVAFHWVVTVILMFALIYLFGVRLR